jgi:hypothetical protein
MLILSKALLSPVLTQKTGPPQNKYSSLSLSSLTQEAQAIIAAGGGSPDCDESSSDIMTSFGE